MKQTKFFRFLHSLRLVFFSIPITAFMFCSITTANAQVAIVPAQLDVLQINNVPTTANQFNVGNTINTICPGATLGGVSNPLKVRCNSLVRASGPGAGISNQQITGILGQVTSEQTASQNTQALEMSNAATSDVTNRLNSIKCRQRMRNETGGVNNSMPECDGASLTTSLLINGYGDTNKAAAGDDSSDRLGLYANGNIGFGDRIATVNAKGYNLDTHGATVGVDYRFSDNFLVGTAFNYQSSRAGFLNNAGKLDTDKYTGTLYASFFTDNGFFVDGLFSGSHIDFDNTRHLEYSVPAETISTNVQGKNSGDEFNVAMTGGYNLAFGGLTVTPQIRVDYTTTQVDALDETGGLGWAMHIDEQQFESLQTAPGVRVSYAISLPWAVIMPMARAEYIHEFENDSRAIISNFALDPSKTRFNVFTDKPDRDYINVSAGISAQFIHGISAFVNYETVQAHSYVNNHNFTGGVRLELPF